MAARSLASLTLSFGLVNVPVKLHSATEAKGAVHFHLLAPDGSRVKQQYVSAKTGRLVERAKMKKGYEIEKNRFVVFTTDELKALDEAASHVIEIVSFVPLEAVDPLFYDTAFFLAPDKRGAKPYALLKEAMRESGRCAIARWVLRGKQYVSQVRAVEDGLILQQLLYADEVSSLKKLDIESAKVSKPELALALQLIGAISHDDYDPAQFKDEEKDRVLKAIHRKVAGKQVIESERDEEEPAGGGKVIDLVEALRASLANKPATKKGGTAAKNAKSADVIPVGAIKDRKKATTRTQAPAKRAASKTAAPHTRTRARA